MISFSALIGKLISMILSSLRNDLDIKTRVTKKTVKIIIVKRRHDERKGSK